MVRSMSMLRRSVPWRTVAMMLILMQFELPESSLSIPSSGFETNSACTFPDQRFSARMESSAAVAQTCLETHSNHVT